MAILHSRGVIVPVAGVFWCVAVWLASAGSSGPQILIVVYAIHSHIQSCGGTGV